jgi:hypothetical protein
VAASGAERHMWQHLRSLDDSDSYHEKANDGEKVYCGWIFYNPAAPGRRSTQPGDFNHKARDQGQAAGKSQEPNSSISGAHT